MISQRWHKRYIIRVLIRQNTWVYIQWCYRILKPKWRRVKCCVISEDKTRECTHAPQRLLSIQQTQQTSERPLLLVLPQKDPTFLEVQSERSTVFSEEIKEAKWDDYHHWRRENHTCGLVVRTRVELLSYSLCHRITSTQRCYSTVTMTHLDSEIELVSSDTVPVQGVSSVAW